MTQSSWCLCSSWLCSQISPLTLWLLQSTVWSLREETEEMLCPACSRLLTPQSRHSHWLKLKDGFLMIKKKRIIFTNTVARILWHGGIYSCTLGTFISGPLLLNLFSLSSHCLCPETLYRDVFKRPTTAHNPPFSDFCNDQADTLHSDFINQIFNHLQIHNLDLDTERSVSYMEGGASTRTSNSTQLLATNKQQQAGGARLPHRIFKNDKLPTMGFFLS